VCGQGDGVGVVCAGALINEEGDLRWARVSARCRNGICRRDRATGVFVNWVRSCGWYLGVLIHGDDLGILDPRRIRPGFLNFK
jgi:hypothetical protein